MCEEDKEKAILAKTVGVCPRMSNTSVRVVWWENDKGEKGRGRWGKAKMNDYKRNRYRKRCEREKCSV